MQHPTDRVRSDPQTANSSEKIIQHSVWAECSAYLRQPLERRHAGEVGNLGNLAPTSGL